MWRPCVPQVCVRVLVWCSMLGYAICGREQNHGGVGESLFDSPPVLFFVPVGTSQLELMRTNMQALQLSYPALEFFFAHYDGVSGRRQYEAQEWYRRSVGNHSCAYSGSKPMFIYRELIAKAQLETDPWLQRFRYVWFADDNIDFSRTDVAALVRGFAQSGAELGQPAVQNSFWKHVTWPANHAPPCAFRYVPFVEVNFWSEVLLVLST